MSGWLETMDRILPRPPRLSLTLKSQSVDSSGGVGGVGGGGIEEKGLMDMDNSVVTVGGEWWVEVEEGIRGINGNGKNTIKKLKF